MKNPKYTLNRIINAFINGYYGRTPHYWERGKYNKFYKVTAKLIKEYPCGKRGCVVKEDHVH